MPVENLKEVQEYLKKNEGTDEIKNYVKGFITPDGVNGFLDTDEGKKLMQPRIDSNFTKGLDTWKENNVKKLVDEQVNKIITEKYPNETPEQKRLKQLEGDLASEKLSRIKSELLASAVTEATQKNLPVEIVKYFVGKDEESTKAAISILEETWKKSMEESVKEKFKDFGRNPSGTDKTLEEQGLYTKAQVDGMSQKEVNADLEKIKKSMALW